MTSQTSKQVSPAPARTVVQDAMRAAVHAPSEREGLDILANGLRPVGDLSANKAMEASRNIARSPRCRVGNLAILSTRSETRVVRIKAHAVDLCYDWKVEVLGSPVWGIDARKSAPAFTNLAFVSNGQLSPLFAEVDEIDSLVDEDVCHG